MRGREKNGGLKWSISPALPALGVGAKRIIKELKVLKSRCILARDVAFPATFPFSANETSRGRGRKTRKSSVTRSKGAEEHRGEGGCWGEKKGTEAGAMGKGRNQEGMECISAPPAETRDERRSALEDTDTFAGENAEKK